MKTIRQLGVTMAIILMISGIRIGWSQQDPMFTQYMFNMMSINPAYAGSLEATNFQALYRLQWLGVEGAPRTLTLSAHAPISGKNMGWGITLYNDRIGPLNLSMVYGNYAYQLILNSATLAFGIKAGLGMYSANLSALDPHDPDRTLVDFRRKILPNVGVGVFYFNDTYYLGLSVPRIIKNHLTVDNLDYGDVKRHYFLAGGYVWNVGTYKNHALKTSFMLRGTEGAPLSFDLTGVFYFNEKLGLGLTYRHKAALTGILQYYISPRFYLGFSYDYATTRLRYVNSGTYEFLLSYDIRNNRMTRIYHPRFF